MNRKIERLTAFIMLSGASLMTLVALSNWQSNANAQTEPEEPVPTMISTSNDKGGMQTRADTVLPSTRYGFRIDVSRPSVTLPRVDISSISLEAEQVGINRTVELLPNTRTQKFVNPDGSQIIALVVRSSGASGIGVHFRNFALAEGEQVYVYGTAPDSIVFGPFTGKGPWGSGEFWSGTLTGDTAVVEFYMKPGGAEKKFEVFEISHIFSGLSSRLGANEPDVLPCEVDASCYGDPEKNAVARIIFNNNGLWYLCTGTLLNDRAQDGTPYFLTANHCVSSQAVAQTVEVYWFYQTTSCNSGVLRSWVHSPPGANLLATQDTRDFCLLRLQNNAPAGAVFSGWDPNAQVLGTSVFGLHHPNAGLPPEIQSYLRRSTGGITSTNDGCFALVNAYRTDWMSGTTEEGSSGSGLWNSSHHLVGVLSCGPSQSTCNSPFSIYSKFANFYSQIRQYLSPNVVATTGVATNVASFSATLNGTVNPGGVATTVHFQYGTSSSYGHTTANQSFNGNTNQTVRANVSGLSANTTYHFRIVATNAGGTAYGSDRTFTTLTATGPPVVTTAPATNVTTSSARLNGTVNPHGLSSTVYFQYGRTTNYASRTPNQTKTGNTYQNIAANISGLSANVTYHFRIVGTNSAGTRYGADRTFTPH